MSKTHLKLTFNVDIAKEVGINSAVIYENFKYWVELNTKKNSNYYDGKYWTYNTIDQLVEVFPFLTAKQIAWAIKKLVNAGYIETGRYNKKKYDKTKWYTVTHRQNCQIEVTKLSIRSDKNVKPIPDINTDIKTDNTVNKQYGNQEVNLVLTLFEKYKGFKPVDYKPRYVANTIIRNLRKIQKENKIDMPINVAIEHLFAVMSTHSHWEKSESLNFIQKRMSQYESHIVKKRTNSPAQKETLTSDEFDMIWGS